MEMVDLEKMRVRDLIVYYLRNEKKDHMPHRDAIIGYRDSTLFSEFGKRQDNLSGK
uniref:Uncharacterized protein n=1 Tax=Candidatus Methanophaga sp. ANME-1 ERB7 TaxID=2759913 RepID=A0A7G9Z7T4_9EURY|nr:hypothetical protein HFIEAGJK_00035 [Methanosarcinales archaeon ANME-1 ERB7]